MSTEQRVIRPFSPLPGLDALAREIRLRVGPDELVDGERVLLTRDVYMHSPVSLVVPEIREGGDAVAAIADELERRDLNFDDVGFAVTLYTRYLKILNFECRSTLTDWLNLETEVQVATPTARPPALQAPHGGCSVEAMFYLRSEKPRQPNRPWRFGTWLARSSFEIVTEDSLTGFIPKSLTAERKAAMKLAAKTVSYVSMGGNSPLEPDCGIDDVELWIDADLLSRLSLMPLDKRSVALQTQFFMLTISEIVAAAVADAGLRLVGWADIETSILGKVISILIPNKSSADARKSLGESYLDMIKGDSQRFMSFIQEKAELGDSIDAQLGL